MQFLSLLSLVALASAFPAIVKRDQDCGDNSYSDDAISAAANAACDFVSNGGTAGRSTYPHQYKDFEGFSFGGLSGPFFEFPILPSGNVYNGGSPGPDRVVIDQSCDIAGVITHSGASGNNFVACSGTS